MARAMLQIRRNPLAFCVSTWRTYGDVVQFPIPTPPSYLVSGPDAVREVLVGRAREVGKRTIQYRSLALVTGQGLLTADTPEWKRQRPLVQPAFHHTAVERVAEHVSRAVGRLIDRWTPRSGQVVDVEAEMLRLSLEVVGDALFGSDLADDAHTLTGATLSALDVVVARARVPITPPAWLPTPANRRLGRAVRQLDGAVRRMVTARAARADAPAHADMLDLILSARDDRGSSLSDSEVRDQIVTFIVAGHETVASALSWAWALLARDPARAGALADEAREVLGGRLPTIADYGRLPLARAVFDETLRLYPPAWLITRNTTAAMELDGRPVPEGALVIISPWIVHRHPDAWSDPEAFDPERFLDGTISRGAFLPFGSGPRLCIGREFAYVEGVLVLAALAAHFTFAPVGPMPHAEPLVTVRPAGGVPLRIAAR